MVLRYPQDLHTPPPAIQYECRRFLPGPRDIIHREYRSNGEMVVLPMPPYAIVCYVILYLPRPSNLANTSIQYDIENACKKCELYLDECRPFVEELINHGTTDEILKITFAEANRYARLHDESTVGNALKVRAFVFRGLRMQDSALGSEIPTVDDPHSKWHGRRPCPPYINYQIDNMVNQIIDKNRKIVLKSLKALVFGKNTISNWYEAYLNIYLLLKYIRICLPMAAAVY